MVWWRSWWIRSRAAGAGRTRRPADALCRALLVIAFAGAKVDALWGKRPLHSGDQFWWDQIGRLSLRDAGFWLAERPFTVPLLHKLAGFSEARVILLQGLLDFVAWVTLAQAISSLMRPLAPKLFAFGLLLGLGLTSGVQGWNAVIRSESASNSFLVLTLAAMLASVHAASRLRAPALEPRHERRTRRAALAWAGLTLASAVLAAFARDNNAYALLVVSLFAPLALLAAGPRPRAARREFFAALTLSVGLLVIAAGSRLNAEAAKRYEWPLMNVVFQRVLPSRAHTAYFARELGMPVSPALLGRSRRFMCGGGRHRAPPHQTNGKRTLGAPRPPARRALGHESRPERAWPDHAGDPGPIRAAPGIQTPRGVQLAVFELGAHTSVRLLPRGRDGGRAPFRERGPLSATERHERARCARLARVARRVEAVTDDVGYRYLKHSSFTLRACSRSFHRAARALPARCRRRARSRARSRGRRAR